MDWLAGKAEATLKAKGESMASGSQKRLDVTPRLQVQMAILLPVRAGEREAVS